MVVVRWKQKTWVAEGVHLHMTTAIVIYKLMKFPNKKRINNQKEPNMLPNRQDVLELHH